MLIAHALCKDCENIPMFQNTLTMCSTAERESKSILVATNPNRQEFIVQSIS